MPSSTSSFDLVAPRLPWRREWFVALTLAALLLAGWESFWRLSGHHPSVEAVDESWILAFDGIEPDSTVVVGTSRSQAALDPRIWAAELGGEPPVMLQLPGNSPLGILERLAEDESFHGLVLVDCVPMSIFDGSGKSEERSNRLLAHRDRVHVNLAQLTEAWLAVNVGSHFVMRNPRLLAVELAKAAMRGDLPNPGVATRRSDGFVPIDFTRMDPLPKRDPVQGFINQDFRLAKDLGEPADEEQTVRILERFERVHAKLMGQGARVIVLWLPACGERASLEERRFPRARYWDRFAATTRARTIALGDEPDFPRIECYDGAHIHAADAPEYTRFMARVVRRELEHP